MDSDHDGMISWPAIRKFILAELQVVGQQMETAVGEEMYRLQGESRRLRKCLNIPSAVTLTQEGNKDA